MRQRVIDHLGSVTYDRFLVYLMGPYESFSRPELGDDADGSSTRRNPSGNADTVDDAFALLRKLQGTLRTEPGVNAFLAVDIDVDLGEVDAVDQSIQFARASNAVVFAVPTIGKNLGVGIEIGTVLQDEQTDPARVLLVHEADVQSAMIRGVGEQWEAQIQTYHDEVDLGRAVRLFVREIMERETTHGGDLEPPH